MTDDVIHFVQITMLTQRVTLDEYLTMHGAINLSEQNTKVKQSIKKRRAEVNALLRLNDGSELWEWSHGPFLGAIGGLAVLRAGDIIRAWRDWRS